MGACSIRSCSSRTYKYSKTRNSFFKIPGVITNQCSKTREYSIKRRSKWVMFINRSDITVDNAKKCRVICNLHFISGKPAQLMDINHPDWAPTLLNRDSEEGLKARAKLQRFTRSMKRLLMDGTNTVNLPKISTSHSKDNQRLDVQMYDEEIQQNDSSEETSASTINSIMLANSSDQMIKIEITEPLLQMNQNDGTDIRHEKSTQTTSNFKIDVSTSTTDLKVTQSKETQSLKALPLKEMLNC